MSHILIFLALFWLILQLKIDPLMFYEKWKIVVVSIFANGQIQKVLGIYFGEFPENSQNSRKFLPLKYIEFNLVTYLFSILLRKP